MLRKLNRLYITSRRDLRASDTSSNFSAWGAYAAAVVLGSCVVALAGLSAFQQAYREAKSVDALAAKAAHCQQLAAQLQEQTAANLTTRTSVQAVVMTSRSRALLDGLTKCHADQVSNTAFKAFEAPPSGRSPLTDFLLSPDSPGSYLYRAVIALIYTAILVCLGIITLWIIGTSLFGNRKVADLVETVRKAIGGGKDSAGFAAGLLAPLLLASPLVLGGLLAVKIDPVPVANATLGITPKVVDQSGNPIESINLPINLDTTVSDGGKGKDIQGPLLSFNFADYRTQNLPPTQPTNVTPDPETLILLASGLSDVVHLQGQILQKVAENPFSTIDYTALVVVLDEMHRLQDRAVRSTETLNKQLGNLNDRVIDLSDRVVNRGSARP